MSGMRCAVLGASGVLVAALLHSRPAGACSQPPPPVALVGVPAEGDSDVPTNVIPVFDLNDASILDVSRLPLATFELVAENGEVVPATARQSHAWHFELVPEEELTPQTRYAINATLPVASDTQELTLSFTTGDGPLDEPPAPPVGSIQHYTTYGSVVISSCSPSENNSCIFFQTPGPIDVAFLDEFGQESTEHYLVFEKWTSNLSGIEQGTSYVCVVLRARAADGALSEPVELCREDGETFPLTGNIDDLACTGHGLTLGGVPIGQGGTGGTGGTATGGTGGTEPEPEPDETGSHTVVTEGCGCVVPGRTRGAGSGVLLVAALLAFARRRAARRPT